MENPANTSSGLDAILYPNPTSGNVTIEFSGSESEHLKFNIYDFTGRKIYDEVIIASVGVNYIYYDFSGYPQGVYFISLEKNDMINTLRVVVR